MDSAALLREAESSWVEPVKNGRPAAPISLLTGPEPVENTTCAAEFAVIPTPAVVRGRFLLAKVGPIVVFALAIAAIIWLWPPF